MLEGSQITAISGGQAVPTFSNALRGRSRAPRTGANRVRNSGTPRGGLTGAFGT